MNSPSAEQVAAQPRQVSAEAPRGSSRGQRSCQWLPLAGQGLPTQATVEPLPASWPSGGFAAVRPFLVFLLGALKFSDFH